jgi:hypothetical protein
MILNSKRREHYDAYAAALLEDTEKVAEENTQTERPSVFTPAILAEIQDSRGKILRELFSNTETVAAADRKLIAGYFSPGFETSTATLEAPGSLKDKFEKLR